MSSLNVHTILKGPDSLPTNHISAVLDNILKFIENGINVIWVFDPKRHIKQKSALQKKRIETTKHRNESKIKEFKETEAVIANEIREINAVDGLTPEQKKELIDAQLKNFGSIANSKDHYEKMVSGKLNIFSIGKADLIKIFDDLSIPYIIAPDNIEAEQLCALLNRTDRCSYVMSKDMDSIVFGAKKLLWRDSKKNKKDHYFLIELDAILGEHKIDQDTLIKACVALGCDFADKTKGVGPVRVLDMVSNAAFQFTEEQKVAINIFKHGFFTMDSRAYVLKELDRVNTMDRRPTKYDELRKWLIDFKGFNKKIAKLDAVFAAK
jgi:5'-3' exonuclease